MGRVSACLTEGGGTGSGGRMAGRRERGGEKMSITDADMIQGLSDYWVRGGIRRVTVGDRVKGRENV